MDDYSTLLNLITEHKWVAATAAAIFLMVRLLKASWIPWPLTLIPPKVRTFVAVLLGFVGAAVERIATGVPWKQAIAENLVAALTAILTHDLVIEWLRNGKEFGASSSQAKTIPPAAPTVLLLVVLGGFGAWGLSACSTFNPKAVKDTTCAIVDTAQQACTMIKFLAADGSTQEIRVPSSELAAYGQAVAAGKAPPPLSSAQCPQVQK